MSSTLMPTPDMPRPELVASLPTLRGMLLEQRRFRLEQIAQLAVDGKHIRREVDGHLDAADSGVAATHGEVTAALAAAADLALADIDAALARMDAGRYGSCQACGGQVGLDRLSVIPQTALCVDCQRRSERRR